MPLKTCFVVAEFGSRPGQAQRTDAASPGPEGLEPRGYEVKRADEITAPGLITHQIIERLLDADLVVADLTGNNPNVFYEMAVRHAAARPIIHILTDGEVIPFDLKDVRTVFYALDDPDRLDEARQQFDAAVTEIEKSPGEDMKNPVSLVRHLRLLEASGDPRAVEIGEILTAVANLGDQVRSLSDQVLVLDPRRPVIPRSRRPGATPSQSEVRHRIRQILNATAELVATEDIIGELSARGMRQEAVETELESMRREGRASGSTMTVEPDGPMSRSRDRTHRHAVKNAKLDRANSLLFADGGRPVWLLMRGTPLARLVVGAARSVLSRWMSPRLGWVRSSGDGDCITARTAARCCAVESRRATVARVLGARE